MANTRGHRWLRNHDGAVAGDEGPVEYQMDFPGWVRSWGQPTRRQPAHGIAESARSVDHHLGLRLEFFSGLDIASDHALMKPSCLW